jgi:hypothetical protein
MIIMRYRFLILLGLLFIAFSTMAQDKFFTKTGQISFISRTPIIDIAGYHNDVISFLSTKTGDLVFAVVMKAFKFDLPLAEEHFNENYAESDLYPNSKFKGKITNMEEIHFDQPGKYTAIVEGELTIHGVTKTIRQTGILVVEKNNISASAGFKIAPEEYGIKIPSLVSDKIAREVDITVKLEYVPYNK